MKNQITKDLYYASFGKLSLAPYWWNRLFGRNRFENALVNIGCGPKYIEGMVNVDGNIFQTKDLWLDVTLGLPFFTNSIRGIYVSHVMEHFRIKTVRRLLIEFHRAIKPGGTLRLVVPSLEYAVNAFTTDNAARLPEWPDKFSSIGGRFNNFLLCANQHLSMFDLSFLEELLNEAGFATVERREPFVSRCFTPQQLRFESDPSLLDKSLYVEAVKTVVSY
jgi:predicted SAM-dependent methyltransferase